jgi:hypothetical protein
MSSLVIRPFEQGDLDAAAGLLAERHRRFAAFGVFTDSKV